MRREHGAATLLLRNRHHNGEMRSRDQAGPLRMPGAAQRKDSVNILHRSVGLNSLDQINSMSSEELEEVSKAGEKVRFQRIRIEDEGRNRASEAKTRVAASSPLGQDESARTTRPKTAKRQ